MIQVYFLSVLLNAATGAALFFRLGSAIADDGGRVGAASHIFSPAELDTFRFALGVATIIAGVLKLLSPIKDDVPFIGDLFPAAAGIVAGFALIYENIRAKKISDVIDRSASIRRLLDSKTYIGIAAMAAAALHFLFPSVVII